MLTRIVRMEFIPEYEKEFLSLFEEINSTIENFPGCLSLQLMQDQDQRHVYYTLSQWQNSESLEHYRKSPFFREVWPQAKQYFAKKAQASSLIEVSGLKK